MKLHLLAATILFAALVQPAFAEPVDSPEAQKLRQIRIEVDAQKKLLLEEKGVSEAGPSSPAEPLELTVDETDSPGATQK